MRNIIFMLILVLNTSIFAETDILAGMVDFKNNPNKYFDNFTATPKEIAINQHNIKSKALEKSYSDGMASELRANFDKRPEYTFTTDELSKSAKVISNSSDIVRGISNEYTDCKTIKKCTEIMSDEIEYCTTSSTPKEYKCERERMVDVLIPNKINKRIKFTLSVTSKFGGTFRYSLKRQAIISATPATSISTTQDININNISCSSFNIRKVEDGFLSGVFTTKVVKNIFLENPSNCDDPILLIYIDQDDYKNEKYRHKTRGIYTIIDISSQDKPIISDSLYGACPELNKRLVNGICKTNKEVCIDGPDTKIINGIAVTRDCWRYKTVYSCGNGHTPNNICAQYDTNKCRQISSECKDYIDGVCVSQLKGYKCPSQSCSDDTNIICGDTKIECLDGSCVDKAISGDSAFNDSISKIAIIDAAIKDKPENFTEDSKFIFPGRVMSCRKTGYGFSDCCKDDGWGVDIGLAQCNSEEKELGENKEKNLVVYVGKNVHKTSEFEPERVDKRYCVFTSKIARIIQEQGRLGQLAITFGSGKYPDCSGISPMQLSKINMDKINLSEIFDDIASKHQEYDSDKLGKKLTTKIKNYYDRQAANNG